MEDLFEDIASEVDKEKKKRSSDLKTGFEQVSKAERSQSF
jgi:hypothetical protein